MPSRRSDAKRGDEDFYSVPLLSLVSINVLKIKDVDIKFSVDMGELTEEPSAEPLASMASEVIPQNSSMKTLNVSTVTGRNGGKVRVALRVKGSEPSDGAARLLDYLAQMQGVYQQLDESTPEQNETGSTS